MFKSSWLLVLVFTLFYGVSSKPQDFIGKDAEKVAKLGDPVNPIKNRGYELATGKQDSQRREEGKKEVKFMVRNWRNESWDILKKKFEKLPKYWVKDGPVKIVVHGWTDMEWEPGRKKDHMKVLNNQVLDITHAYQNRNNTVNVIAMDWVHLATENAARYDYVVGNTKIVGEVLADFLLNLADKEVQNSRRIHIVGYGMGAHVAGVAGKIFYDDYKKKIGRISGINPVGPGFDDPETERRKDSDAALTEDDAYFVDVMHCTGGTTNIYLAQAKGKYGSDLAAGHVDFFPNGGEEQPGCKKMNEHRSEKACSMKKCVQYYISSIEGVEYIGCPCKNLDDWKAGVCKCNKRQEGEVMGDPCHPSARGRYYVKIEDDNMGILTKYI